MERRKSCSDYSRNELGLQKSKVLWRKGFVHPDGNMREQNPERRKRKAIEQRQGEKVLWWF